MKRICDSCTEEFIHYKVRKYKENDLNEYAKRLYNKLKTTPTGYMCMECFELLNKTNQWFPFDKPIVYAPHIPEIFKNKSREEIKEILSIVVPKLVKENE